MRGLVLFIDWWAAKTWPTLLKSFHLLIAATTCSVMSLTNVSMSGSDFGALLTALMIGAAPVIVLLPPAAAF